jgi:hypothetical protein
MLKEYDLAISHEDRSSLQWLITDISKGSLTVVTESRSILPNKDFGRDVTKAYFTGWERIENDGSSPPYLTESGIKAARRIAQRIGKEGMEGVVVSAPDFHVTISERASENIKELLSEQNRSLGSAEGTLETVSIHRGRRFVIYHSITKRQSAVILHKDLIFLNKPRRLLGVEYSWKERCIQMHAGSRYVYRSGVCALYAPESACRALPHLGADIRT